MWLYNRRRDRWRIRTQTEISGPNGGPVKIEGKFTKLEAARRVARLLTQAAAPPSDKGQAAETPPDAEPDEPERS